jgi:hypothetical protein
MFGCIRILVFPKGSEEMYAYIIEMLCQMLSCFNVGCAHILVFPKGSEELYACKS